METTQALPTSVVVIGRRWFEHTNGNTYHTVAVYVDGRHVFKSGLTYGYGNQYLQTAEEALEALGLLPGLNHYPSGASEALWAYCERRGIAYSAEVVDVGRKRDL